LDLDSKIRTIEQDLDAVDRALSLHEIPIDPRRIRAIREHEKGRWTSYGGLTRMIFRCLSELKGNSASTREIAVTVAAVLGIDPELPEFLELRTRIRYRLKNLAVEDKLVRVRHAKSAVESRWALPNGVGHLYR